MSVHTAQRNKSRFSRDAIYNIHELAYDLPFIQHISTFAAAVDAGDPLPQHYYYVFNGVFFHDNLGKPATERQTILDFNEARHDGWQTGSGITRTI